MSPKWNSAYMGLSIALFCYVCVFKSLSERLNQCSGKLRAFVQEKGPSVLGPNKTLRFGPEPDCAKHTVGIYDGNRICPSYLGALLTVVVNLRLLVVLSIFWSNNSNNVRFSGAFFQDLVKTHLTYAVREEVEILRSTIVDLEAKVGQRFLKTVNVQSNLLDNARAPGVLNGISGIHLIVNETSWVFSLSWTFCFPWAKL